MNKVHFLIPSVRNVCHCSARPTNFTSPTSVNGSTRSGPSYVRHILVHLFCLDTCIFQTPTLNPYTIFSVTNVIPFLSFSYISANPQALIGYVVWLVERRTGWSPCETKCVGQIFTGDHLISCTCFQWWCMGQCSVATSVTPKRATMWASTSIATASRNVSLLRVTNIALNIFNDDLQLHGLYRISC
jgi:hypothetical protein